MANTIAEAVPIEFEGYNGGASIYNPPKSTDPREPWTPAPQQQTRQHMVYHAADQVAVLSNDTCTLPSVTGLSQEPGARSQVPAAHNVTASVRLLTGFVMKVTPPASTHCGAALPGLHRTAQHSTQPAYSSQLAECHLISSQDPSHRFATRPALSACRCVPATFAVLHQ